MRSLLHFAKLILLVASLLTATSCTQEGIPETTNSTVKEDYQSYSKDGLSLQHPSHWSLAYDDNDALLSDRDISFETPGFSKISVLLYEKSSVNESEVADIFERTSKLKSSKNVEAYQRTAIEIAGFQGYQLTWKNTLLGISTFELTILKTNVSTKSVFAVFLLLDEDIQKESSNLIPFIKSISLQQIAK